MSSPRYLLIRPASHRSIARGTGLDSCRSYLGPCRATEGQGARFATLFSRAEKGHAGPSRVRQGHTEPLLLFPPPPLTFSFDDAVRL